jgi:hypothetical protein
VGRERRKGEVQRFEVLERGREQKAICEKK